MRPYYYYYSILLAYIAFSFSIPLAIGFVVPRRQPTLGKISQQHNPFPQQLTILQSAKKDKVSLLPTITTATTKPSYTGYNDDAFGLLFLTSGVATKDVAFGIAFCLLSALAATLTTTGTWNKNNDPRAPGLVAIVSLVFGRPLVAYGVLPTIERLLVGNNSLAVPVQVQAIDDLPMYTDAPPTFEILACLVSLGWSLYQWKQSLQNV